MFFFSGGLGKIKLKLLPHFHVSDTCVGQFNPTLPLQQQPTLLLRPGVRASRPDLIWPAGDALVSGGVGLARAHPLTKTQAMEPSRQTRSNYGTPYWGVGPQIVLFCFFSRYSTYVFFLSFEICLVSEFFLFLYVFTVFVVLTHLAGVFFVLS